MPVKLLTRQSTSGLRNIEAEWVTLADPFGGLAGPALARGLDCAPVWRTDRADDDDFIQSAPAVYSLRSA